jgi:Zn-dependent alcohol dehydrogenase
VQAKTMISHRYTLEEIDDAYDRLGRGEVAHSSIRFPGQEDSITGA